MSATKPQAESERWAVCGDCARALLTSGARAVPRPIVIALGHGCDAHGRIYVPQATHAVMVPPELASLWVPPSDGPLAPLGASDRTDDAPLVARLAVQLLGERRDLDEIAGAVICARRVLAAARGE